MLPEPRRGSVPNFQGKIFPLKKSKGNFNTSISPSLLNNDAHLFESEEQEERPQEHREGTAGRSAGVSRKLKESWEKPEEEFACETCEIPVDFSTKHCNVCHRCTEGFDHHCCWLGKCIGKVNYKEFVWFCLALLVVSIFGGTLAWICIRLESVSDGG
jgi:hypothetical protein